MNFDSILQGRLYTFDKVFKPSSSQEHVYTEAAKPIVSGNSSFCKLIIHLSDHCSDNLLSGLDVNRHARGLLAIIVQCMHQLGGHLFGKPVFRWQDWCEIFTVTFNYERLIYE